MRRDVSVLMALLCLLGTLQCSKEMEAPSEPPAGQSKKARTRLKVENFVDRNGNGEKDKREELVGSFVRIWEYVGDETVVVEDCYTPCEISVGPMEEGGIVSMRLPEGWEIVRQWVDGVSAAVVCKIFTPSDGGSTVQYCGADIDFDPGEIEHEVLFQNEIELLDPVSIPGLVEDAWVKLVAKRLSEPTADKLDRAFDAIVRAFDQGDLDKVNAALADAQAIVAAGDPSDAVLLGDLEHVLDFCQLIVDANVW